MAMTLRLDAEDDAALSALAAAEGISKQEAVVRAIREKAAHLNDTTDVRRLTREAIGKYESLLDRLSQ